VGVAVAQGQLGPDISTLEAWQKAVRSASAVFYTHASSGQHIHGLLSSMGMLDEVRSKAHRFDNGEAMLLALSQGGAPPGAMAMGAIYQSLAHSTGILYENAASSQQQLAIAAQAATNQGVIQIYSVDTMAGAVAASKISQSDTPEVENPDNKWIKVDGMQVHEIHPKPGVTCFVVYNNGISCLKD
jgi:hypothetical protein